MGTNRVSRSLLQTPSNVSLEKDAHSPMLHSLLSSRAVICLYLPFISGADAFENREIYGTYMHLNQISYIGKLYVTAIDV
jgi:hypothetical protein